MTDETTRGRDGEIEQATATDDPTQDQDERAEADLLGFVPPVSIGDVFPASREMLEEAWEDLEDEIEGDEDDADIIDDPEALAEADDTRGS